MEPVIRGSIHTDEAYVPVGKGHGYDLNSIDSKTKYVLAHLYTERRTLTCCIALFRQIKTTCYGQMLDVYDKEKHKPAKERKLVTFVSDGFENYRNAFNKLFYNVCNLRFGVPIACRKYGLEHNNNPIERHNGSIKDRIKTMRDFGSHAGASAFLGLKRTIHNFVNPHMGLKGATPAEAAGIDLGLGRMKLLNLLRICGQKKHHSLR